MPRSKTALVHILSTCRGMGSGAERVLEYLLEAGQAELPSIIRVIAPAQSSVFQVAQRFDYPVQPWPNYGRSSLLTDWTAAFRTLRLRQGELIHSWHMRSFELAAGAAAISGAGFTGTMHDHPALNPYSQLRKALAAWGSSRMSALACVSEALRDECVAMGWKTPIKIIPNGLPSIPFHSRRPFSRRRLAFLGCNVSWKGGDIVAALARSPALADMEFHLYGDLSSASAPSLVSLIQESRENVHYHGTESPDLIYAETDIILHPSIRFDPYPTVLLEAARAGLPVICSPAGGSGKIVVHGQTGFILSTQETSLWVETILALAEENLWTKISLEGRRRFESQFQANPMVAAYRTLWARG